MLEVKRIRARTQDAVLRLKAKKCLGTLDISGTERLYGQRWPDLEP